MASVIRIFRTATLFAISIAFAAVPTFADIPKDRLEKRAAKIATTIENIQVEDSSRIPAEIIQRAHGVIVLRQFEAGFVFGGKGGFGMAFKRDKDGKWGPPAWIKTGEGSWGLQIGAQSLNVVLLIMNEKGMRMLRKAKFRIGIDAAATAGPTGRSGRYTIGSSIPILAYTDSEGFYAGATFEGGFLLPDNKSNFATYQDSLSVPDIISNETLPTPEYAEKIVKLLEAIEIE